MKTITIPEDGSFELLKEFQDLKQVTLRMPFCTKVFQGKSIGTYFRQPAKDKPYCKNGTLEIGVNGIYETFITINEEGKQIFWETPEIDKFGNPKDERKTKVVPKGQKTLI